MLIIVFTSKGDPLFVQIRVGLRNRKFRQYKLRTMYLDADEMKKDLIDKNVIIKLSVDKLSSIEEYYVENDRKDIEGNSIEPFDLSKYVRGHKIPRADGGANGLGTGNVQPQLGSDNLSYGRSEVPNKL